MCTKLDENQPENGLQGLTTMFSVISCWTGKMIGIILFVLMNVYILGLSWYQWFSLHHIYCPPLSQKCGDIKSHSSVCPSVCPSVTKTLTLAITFALLQIDRALILGMCVPCDKTFPEVPCCDLWPTLRSNLLPSGDHNSMNLLVRLSYHLTLYSKWVSLSP